MKNNKGLSYYELMIVIAIMALMVGFSTITIGTVSRNNIKRSADNVESTIKEARNNAISKGSKHGYANFYYDGKTLYGYVGEKVPSTFSSVETDTTRTWEKLSYNLDEFSVHYENAGGGFSVYNIPSGALINICFKQATGEIVDFETTYTGSVYKVDEVEFWVGRNNKEAKVKISKYGKIVIE